MAWQLAVPALSQAATALASVVYVVLDRRFFDGQYERASLVYCTCAVLCFWSAVYDLWRKTQLPVVLAATTTEVPVLQSANGPFSSHSSSLMPLHLAEPALLQASIAASSFVYLLANVLAVAQ